MEMTETSVQV